MEALAENDKKRLIQLARSVITAKLVEAHSLERPTPFSAPLKEKRGCFVTLHKKKALRGCIGTIEPVKSLWRCVEENALNAAFHDPRFPPLEKSELNEVDLEISVLTLPKPLSAGTPETLAAKLIPGIHGVILSRGYHRATFLPQVWEQLPGREQFLEHLCLKAGIEKKAWRDKATTLEIYEVEYFSEN